MKKLLFLCLFYSALIACLAGCNDQAGSGTDGGTDAGTDAGSDTDGGTDGGADAGSDADGGAECLEDHDDWTVGLIACRPGVFNGYTLFAPNGSKTTYLIDIHGRLVNKWESDYTPGQSAYLLENGHLLRAASPGPLSNQTFRGGGIGGIVQEFDWEGNIVWEYRYSDDRHCQHHDIERLPNGNVLLVAWEHKTRAEAIEAGRDPDLLREGELWPDHLVEIAPSGPESGDIVWEWRIWDHLVQDHDPEKANYGTVADHPELLDVNYVGGRGGADWNHVNSVDYNEDLDQIILSPHNMGEIFVVDHSTTTAEAAGHQGGVSGKGGDILYRWGNPRVYRAGEESDQKFFGQHDAYWIESGLLRAGNIMVFNNGLGRPDGGYSSVEEVDPPVDPDGNYSLSPGPAYGPEQPAWIYTAENRTDFYSSNISGAQRLPNGNTLICNGGNGILFEITPDEEIVWTYINPVTNRGPIRQGDPIPQNPSGNTNNVFRAYRYAPDYPGLSGRDLTPGDYIELPAI